MKFLQAKNYTKAQRTTVDLIVIHTMEYPEKPTGAEWCADFFAGAKGLQAPKASAHYCVDSDSIVQCVRDEDIAWHAPGANHNGIGIEHAGFAAQTPEEWADEFSTSALELSAQLAAQLCHRWHVPPRRPSLEELKGGARGIVGHKDCTDAFNGGRGHYDPGPSFPWSWYLARVEFHLAALEGRASYAQAVEEELPSWPRVQLDGETWAVAPIYVPFVGIGQAEELARALGCELPSPELVDAVWKAADLKLDASVFVRADHDGTMTSMSSPELLQKQAERIAREVGSRSLGRDFLLLAGPFKDVVKTRDGRLGLYGWHRASGVVIQPFYGGHARGWIDYSQGLRLCRRVSS